MKTFRIPGVRRVRRERRHTAHVSLFINIGHGITLTAEESVYKRTAQELFAELRSKIDAAEQQFKKLVKKARA